MPASSRKNLNVMIVGADGRMGRAIGRLAPAAGLRVVSKIGRGSVWPASGRGIDAVIEFSSTAGLLKSIDWCLKNKKPLVSGATGLEGSAVTRLKKAAKKIPILHSANMSLGVAVMIMMLRQFGAVADWRFTLEETHHTKKKDKPSGTAKLLAMALANATGTKWPPIKSVRKGQVPGTHQIEAFGPDETILLRHTAHDRRIFARGAIRAARWLFDKNRPGLYDLSDLYRARVSQET